MLDDWGISPLTDSQRRDLFELVEDRYERRATLIAAQMPVKHWHELIGEPTPFSIDSSTTHTPLRSKENPCERKKQLDSDTDFG